MHQAESSELNLNCATPQGIIASFISVRNGTKKPKLSPSTFNSHTQLDKKKKSSPTDKTNSKALIHVISFPLKFIRFFNKAVKAGSAAWKIKKQLKAS